MVSKAWNCVEGANLSVELEKFENGDPDIIRVRVGVASAVEFRVSSPEALAQLRNLGPALAEACSFATVKGVGQVIPFTKKSRKPAKKRRR